MSPFVVVRRRMNRSVRGLPYYAVTLFSATLIFFVADRRAAVAQDNTPTWSSTAADLNWANSANWNNGVVAGSIGTTQSPVSATFNTPTTQGTVESGNTPIAVDAGRNVKNVVFAGTAGSYVIGSAGGNALHLTSGGQIIITPEATNPEVVDAPLLVELDASYQFTNNSTTSTATLTIGSVMRQRGRLDRDHAQRHEPRGQFNRRDR